MSLYVFNNSQKLIRIISNNDLIHLTQEQELNKTGVLFTEIPVNIWRELPEKAFYLAVKDPYSTHGYFMYKVTHEVFGVDSVEIQAVDIALDELKGKGYIKDRRFNGTQVTEAMNAIVDGTDWVVGYVDTALPKVHTNFYYISRLEALGKLIEVVGGEVKFRVEVSGNAITSKRIDIYKRMSKFKGKRFALGSNLMDVVKEEDSSGLYTALVGRGKGEELEGDTEAYGRRISFKDIEWKKSAGDPVDKPLGQEFVELPERTSIYGYPDGTPRTGIVEFTDTEEPVELLQQTYDTLLDISRPQRQFKAVVETAGDMELGETVAIISPDFRYQTRVFKVRRNLLNNNHTEVEFGDKLTQTMGERIENIQSSTDSKIDETVTIVQGAANGKNKIFRGEIMPTTGMAKGDLWYKPVGSGEYEIWQFTGDRWERIVHSGMSDEVKQELEKVEQNAQEARDRTEAIEKDANSIMSGLGLDPIGETHQIIVDGIQGNLTGRFDTVNNRVDSITGGLSDRINGLSLDVTEFSGSLNARLDDIMGNIEGIEGDFSSFADKVYVDSQVDRTKGEITTIIAGIKESPEQTIHGYNAMKSTVDGNVSEIARISQKADGNEAKYNTFTETVDGVSREIANVKAYPEYNITGYNTMKSTVAGNTSEIARVERKADSTDTKYNNFVETVDGVKRDISAVRTSPKTMITGYNTMSNTVDGNQSMIAQIRTNPEGTITNYNKLTENKDMVERVIGRAVESDTTIKNRIARNVMTNNMFRTEVTERIDDIELGGRNMIWRSEWDSSGGVETEDYSVGKGYGLKVTSKSGYGWNRLYNYSPRKWDLEWGKSYTISFRIRGSSVFSTHLQIANGNSANRATQYHFDVTRNTTKHTHTFVYRGELDYPNSSFQIFIESAEYTQYNRTVWLEDVMVEEGNVATDWTPAPDELSSKVTQLSNSWALRLENNDDLVTAINATTKGVYIKGEKIQLDGNVDVLGSFKVTGDMLAYGITASKITTGTLNAAEVNLINVNVNSLVGNTSNFIQSNWNSISHYVSIDGSGINLGGSNTSAKLTSIGYEFWRDGAQHGRLETLRSNDTSGAFEGMYSVSLAAERTAYAGISYRSSTTGPYTRAIGVSSIGNIYMNNIHPTPTDGRGFSFSLGNVNEEYGVWLQNKNGKSGIFFAYNGYVGVRINGKVYDLGSYLGI